MDALPLGLAAPVIGSALGSVGRVASAVRSPFTAIFEAASQKLPSESAGVETELEGLQGHLGSMQRNLEQRILEALSSAGIEIDGPIELKISEFDGSLEVSNGHPQRAVIEAALAADASIAVDFRRLSAIHSLLNTSEPTDLDDQNATYKGVLEVSSQDSVQLRFN